MSRLRLNAVVTPTTPASGKVEIFQDSVDKKVKTIDDTGSVYSLTPDSATERNSLVNGGFDVAQRQVAGTLTSYAATADRVYGPDRWGLSVQTSSLQFQQVDTMSTIETGITARYYGKLKQITAGGKFILSQVMEANEVAPLRGRTVRVQAKMRYSVTGAMTVRMGLFENANAATADVIVNPWTTAWGANGTDPTFGANLAKITPIVLENCSLASTAATCVLTAGWLRFSFTAVIPTNCKNLIFAVWSNSQLAVNDEFNITEVGVFDGREVKDWAQLPPHVVLNQCQRYYAKTFPPNTAPAQNAGVAGALRGMVAIAGAVTTSSTMEWRYPQPMRVAPTIVFYNPSAANAFLRNIAAATDATATSAANITADTAEVNATGLAAWTVGQQIKVHAAATAEI